VSAASDRALVRLPVVPGPWAEALPPVPNGREVTVSFSSPGARLEHAATLELLGYRVVGDTPRPDTPDGTAWMLVASEVAAGHPRWWAGVRACADAVYRTAMGPVRAWAEPITRAHDHAPAR
jgi:hypothetical protein